MFSDGYYLSGRVGRRCLGGRQFGVFVSPERIQRLLLHEGMSRHLLLLRNHALNGTTIDY